MSWNKPSNTNVVQPKAKKNVPSWVFWAIGVVIVGIVGTWWLMSPDADDGSRVADKQDKTIKDLGKGVKPKSQAKEPQGNAESVAKTKPKEKMDVFVGPPPTVIKKSNKPPFKLPEVPKRTFSTGLEQQISWIINSKPGDMPPLFIPLDDEDMKDLPAILISKSEIKEGDSEALAECKKSVDFAKKEMVKFIKEGGDPNEFLRYYHNELHRCYEWREEAIRQASEIYDKEPALCKDFIKKINEKFEAEGIMPIEKDMFGDEEEDQDQQASPN